MAEILSDVTDDPLSMLLEEIQQGKGMSLAAAVRPLPAHRGSGRVNPATAFRWVTRGVRTPGGKIVKLAAARVGGRYLTSAEALNRFLRATTLAVCPGEPLGPETRRRPVPRAATAAQVLARRGA